ncbi:MAG TPA: hypothetical protein VE983_12980 [Solirubrobacteraceae bacterium]|nr:hypothetical protein [Solirubrobacteraceae bacterium]
MSQEPDPAELVGRTAAPELLAEEQQALPESVGRPDPIPPSRTRARLVGAGATMTGLTLVGGLGLIVLAIADSISSGLGAAALVALVLGVVLVATHWGWVHVAEFSANRIDEGRTREISAAREHWLGQIAPYTRYEVMTQVEDDGSLTIATVRYRPVPKGQDRFTFVREVLHPEHHSGEEPAALITERAEHLRRQAALTTERERSRYQVAADAYEAALMAGENEEEQVRARRAASEALSKQINTNLRDPPLTE